MGGLSVAWISALPPRGGGADGRVGNERAASASTWIGGERGGDDPTAASAAAAARPAKESLRG